MGQPKNSSLARTVADSYIPYMSVGSSSVLYKFNLSEIICTLK